MDSGGERIGLNGAAVILGISPEAVRRHVAEGRLTNEDQRGGYSFSLSEVEDLAGTLGPSQDEEIFEGEVMWEDGPGNNSRLPAVPFERYERLLQQGQDYKTRLEERTRQMDEIRQERDAARVEMDRLWSEIERLNLIEYQREIQEKAISTLEEEKAKLEADRERLQKERNDLIEEKSAIAEERTRLEAEVKIMKTRGFWSRLLGG